MHVKLTSSTASKNNDKILSITMRTEDKEQWDIYSLTEMQVHNMEKYWQKDGYFGYLSKPIDSYDTSGETFG